MNSSYCSVNSNDAVHIRKIKKGHRFPGPRLERWRVRQKRRRECARRKNKNVEFNWMHIEQIAAVRIQALCRRAMDRQRLERYGMTTSSMRNAMRQRATKIPRRVVTDDVPGMFRCCGVGLLFGGSGEVWDDWGHEKGRILHA